ncbi:MAG: enolase C-terminal domain-like protein [Desulfatiglandales bacterium]|nr:enolase C-terminal domain-like protein [Desulfatiglandales bacterium]
MKITDMKIHVIRRGHKSEDKTITTAWMEAPVITIMTDEGVEGISCGKIGMALAQYLINFKPLILGENPLYIERIWQKLLASDRIFMYPQPALGAIDMALWDISGKVANLPIYQMLGAYRDNIKAYYSFKCDTLEAYVEGALESKAKGFIAYKHKPLPRKPESKNTIEGDIELCRAVRDVVGKEMILMFDPIGIYRYEEALRVGRELDKLNYYWYEEPIPDQNILELITLSNKLDTPIAGLEAYPASLQTITQYLISGAVKMVRSNALNQGGITELKKIAALTEAFGLNFEITTSANPIANVANLHVSCAIKNCEFFEWWVPTKQLWDFGVVKESLNVDNQGNVHAPQGPGLGLELDWDYIDDHTVAKL